MRIVFTSLFGLSVAALAACFVLPNGYGVSWESSITFGMIPLGLLSIVLWVISSGLSNADKAQGKVFGRPRIHWIPAALWFVLAGGLGWMAASEKYNFAESNLNRTLFLTLEQRRGDHDRVLQRYYLEDAELGRTVSAVSLGTGLVFFVVGGTQLARRKHAARPDPSSTV